jgi:SAM-dependent methyltransferase
VITKTLIPLARGVKNAVLLLCQGDWHEFIVRLRISLGQVDLKHDSSETVTDRTHYYADSGGLEFEKIMAHFTITATDAIIDYGCGKGGILITLAKYPFVKITGVEISPELVEIAKNNIEKLNLKNIEITCCDASEFKQLDDFNYVYFFDPFPAVVMLDVIKNIEESIRKVPRRVTIIYLNPFCHDLIETKSAFKKVRELPHFEHKCFVYSNVS